MDHGAESFSEHLNTKFSVKLDSAEPVELELVELVVRKSEPNEQAGMERFSTFFYGPASFFLPQQTYDLVHSEMEKCNSFWCQLNRIREGLNTKRFLIDSRPTKGQRAKSQEQSAKSKELRAKEDFGS